MSFNAAQDPPPSPPPASVRRFNADGTPTPEQIAYEQKLKAWLMRLAAATGA